MSKRKFLFVGARAVRIAPILFMNPNIQTCTRSKSLLAMLKDVLMMEYMDFIIIRSPLS